jgi:hypothetical protein
LASYSRCGVEAVHGPHEDVRIDQVVHSEAAATVIVEALSAKSLIRQRRGIDRFLVYFLKELRPCLRSFPWSHRGFVL